jgi:GTPase SAR1 family protein
MNNFNDRQRTKLVIIEGIVGSGKTTMLNHLIEELSKLNVKVQGYHEFEVPTVAYDDNAISNHRAELRQLSKLPHPNHIWIESDQEDFDSISAELMEIRLGRAQLFVEESQDSDSISIFDGGLFHRDTDCLLIMNVDRDRVREHTYQFLQVLEGLRPVLVYPNQQDTRKTLQRVHQLRGEHWHHGETSYLISSPYGQKMDFVRFDGYVQLYDEIKQFHRELYSEIRIPRTWIETTRAAWSDYSHQILDSIGLI